MQLIRTSAVLLAFCCAFLLPDTVRAQLVEADQIAFLRKVSMELFYRSELRAEIKKIFKSNTPYTQIKNFVDRMENGEPPEKLRIYRETPCSYYTFLGL